MFAGIHRSRNGKVTPTGVGRICNWTPDIKGPPADDYPSFGAYQRSLTLKCDEGEPGIITWTPDKNTPDTVYYQCFTHRYLGWKINVVDACDGQTQASNREEVYVDIEAEPSIKHEQKLYPSENFLHQHEKDLIKHHNMNGAPPKVHAEIQKNGEFNKLITEGIRAAEMLEDSILREQRQNETKVKLPQSIGIESHDDKELIEAIAKIPPSDGRPQHRPPPRRQPVPQSGPPVFLRPPQSINYPFYAPVKLPQRRPIAHERRPVNRKPISPYLLPQQSIMINHYKKPSFGPPPMGVRNYMKSKMPPVPPKPMAPVLLLGEPTEIKPTQRLPTPELVIGKPSKTQIDISPQYKFKKNQEPPRQYKHQQHKKTEKYPTRSPFKDPFDIKTDSIQLREASNTGFKADTIIVESGFRPIFRREDVVHRETSSEESGERRVPNKERRIPNGERRVPSISRRSDNFEGSEEESDDGLLINEEAKSQFFEPMFIPSPRDSIALPLVNNTDDQDDHMVADASERHDSFYLPPGESKRSVSYDAKAVLDTSLLNDPSPSQNDFIKLSSKTKQFIKDTPQFAPFTGELPKDLMLQLSAARSDSGGSKNKSLVISTKLSAVRTNDGTRRKRKLVEKRTK